jgi:hypothetical protein
MDGAADDRYRAMAAAIAASTAAATVWCFVVFCP